MDHRLPGDLPTKFGTVASLSTQISEHITQMQAQVEAKDGKQVKKAKPKKAAEAEAKGKAKAKGKSKAKAKAAAAEKKEEKEAAPDETAPAKSAAPGPAEETGILLH